MLSYEYTKEVMHAALEVRHESHSMTEIACEKTISECSIYHHGLVFGMEETQALWDMQVPVAAVLLACY